ncbi:dentin sialophosphoprotein, partial [Vibrio alginolyticus]|nr:dentin sialophosphoprotein [Vibrio alginolyticus]MDW2088870.1 dentin sialophosphoprotein [Vibrio sp. 2134-1]
GITTVGQNAGSNSLVQQSVTTNASVFTGGE